MTKLFCLHFILLCTFVSQGQAKLVINGGILIITNGASLVVDNPDNTAISQTGSGYIQSEGASNRILWSVGAGNGLTYLLPFGNVLGYRPVRFSALSGSAGGKLFFSTYPTATYKNSDFLPPGVTNVNNSGGADNSAKFIDRFWQVAPQGYTTNPTISNLVFTYADNEYNAPNNITEANMVAQRWNPVTAVWTDYVLPSSINTVTNTVTVASIPGTQLFNWFSLVDATVPLPLTLVFFNATAKNKKVETVWQTASENNADHFEVWRSQNLLQFDSVGRKTAAGNSNTSVVYSLTDARPYNGISFYRLKAVDRDKSFKWSSTVRVLVSEDSYVSLYPNPATTQVVLTVSADLAAKKPSAKIFDAKGSLVRSFNITSVNQAVNVSALAAGMYQIHFLSNDKTQTVSFEKAN